MREDRLDHPLVVRVQHLDHLRAREPFAERGEVADVAEQDRHLAALAGGGAVGQPLDVRGDLRGEVSAQPFPPAVLLGDAVDEVDGAPRVVHAAGGHPGHDSDPPDRELRPDPGEHQQQHLERGTDREGEDDA